MLGWRPPIPSMLLVEQPGLVKLIKEAWADESCDRPSFIVIDKTLAELPNLAAQMDLNWLGTFPPPAGHGVVLPEQHGHGEQGHLGHQEHPKTDEEHYSDIGGYDPSRNRFYRSRSAF